MVIISKKTINEFCQKHTDATKALQQWYKTVSKANWNSFADLKKDFGSTDFVGENRYVFNIKGNHYRIVALVFFSVRTVYIKFIGTHEDYNRIDVRTIDIK